VLEPGEYVSEPNDLDYPPIAIKAPLRAQACTWGSGWCFAFGPQGWVRAARRVEVEPEDTRSPFQKRNGLNADGTIRRVEARAEPTEGPESLLQACALLEQTSQGEPK